MKDPFFEQTVVLVWQHDEDGAIGVVVNRPLKDVIERGIMPKSASSLLVDVLVLDEDLDMSSYAEDEVSWGGPVDTDSGTIVTAGTIDDDEGWLLPGGIAVTRSHDALVRLVKANANLMLCLGYAGWGRGQLDREISEGSWLFTELDPGLLFEVPPAERYDRAFQALGVPKELVWMQPIDE
ncbi:MAG: YqgE/AlgH family protein [Myxococcota bacterium]